MKRVLIKNTNFLMKTVGLRWGVVESHVASSYSC